LSCCSLFLWFFLQDKRANISTRVLVPGQAATSAARDTRTITRFTPPVATFSKERQTKEFESASWISTLNQERTLGRLLGTMGESIGLVEETSPLSNFGNAGVSLKMELDKTNCHDWHKMCRYRKTQEMLVVDRMKILCLRGLSMQNED